MSSAAPASPSDPRRAEEQRRVAKLARAYRLLRQVLDLLPFRVVVSDAAGNTLIANQVTEHLHRPDEVAVHAPTSAAHSFDLEVLDDTGVRHVLHTQKIPFLLEDASRPHLLSVTTDVTESRRAEHDAREATVQLRGIRDDLRVAMQVFEHCRESIMLLDRERRVILVNPAFVEITGYTLEDVVGERPNAIRSGQHGDAFYASIWAEVRQHGFWQGELTSRKRSGEVYPQWLSITAVRGEGGEIEQYISIATDITDHKSAQQRINYLAHHDAITGLPNRALFEDRLGQAVGHASHAKDSLALVYVDIDRFKHVNDSLGHPAGDALLHEVGARLAALAPAEATVCRYGGDEFVLLIPAMDAAQVGALAERLLVTLREPVVLGETRLATTASVGISVFPDDARSATDLIKSADLALYHAKEQGRNQFQFFCESMNLAAAERIRIESGLRGALEQQELQLYLQPQHDLRSGALVGAEALLRWRDASRADLVSPATFIPVAEDCGLIVPIGDWVLRETCKTIGAWLERGLPAVPVAVNVSARQFEDKHFVETVRSALRESGIDGGLLVLEITESAMLRSAERVLDAMRELSPLGVQLALDDFGTGFSNLSYLKKLPLNRLKIDRSFTAGVPGNEHDTAIVGAVLGLARSFGLGVIAEGVETAAQAEFLQSIGCRVGQGYLWSQPISAPDFATRLEEIVSRGLAAPERPQHPKTQQTASAETERAATAATATAHRRNDDGIGGDGDLSSVVRSGRVQHGG
jgi:diguanylate cyclase (GGDEF)-like protein/PAS domain S-box-containing protein